MFSPFRTPCTTIRKDWVSKLPRNRAATATRRTRTRAKNRTKRARVMRDGAAPSDSRRLPRDREEGHPDRRRILFLAAQHREQKLERGELARGQDLPPQD